MSAAVELHQRQLKIRLSREPRRAAAAFPLSELVEYELADGSRLLVEVDEASAGPVMRGGRGEDLVTKAEGTLEQALHRIGPATAAAFEQLRQVANPPDEIEIEFGIKLSADLGAIVARTGGEANFQITLRWRHG